LEKGFLDLPDADGLVVVYAALLSLQELIIGELEEQLVGSPVVVETQGADCAGGFVSAGSVGAEKASRHFFVDV
jgi:hypothetical protein